MVDGRSMAARTRCVGTPNELPITLSNKLTAEFQSRSTVKRTNPAERGGRVRRFGGGDTKGWMLSRPKRGRLCCRKSCRCLSGLLGGALTSEVVRLFNPPIESGRDGDVPPVYAIQTKSHYDDFTTLG